MKVLQGIIVDRCHRFQIECLMYSNEYEDILRETSYGSSVHSVHDEVKQYRTFSQMIKEWSDIFQLI